MADEHEEQRRKKKRRCRFCKAEVAELHREGCFWEGRPKTDDPRGEPEDPRGELTSVTITSDPTRIAFRYANTGDEWFGYTGSLEMLEADAQFREERALIYDSEGRTDSATADRRRAEMIRVALTA